MIKSMQGGKEYVAVIDLLPVDENYNFTDDATAEVSGAEMDPVIDGNGYLFRNYGYTSFGIVW